MIRIHGFFYILYFWVYYDSQFTTAHTDTSSVVENKCKFALRSSVWLFDDFVTVFFVMDINVYVFSLSNSCKTMKKSTIGGTVTNKIGIGCLQCHLLKSLTTHVSLTLTQIYE